MHLDSKDHPTMQRLKSFYWIDFKLYQLKFFLELIFRLVSFLSNKERNQERIEE